MTKKTQDDPRAVIEALEATIRRLGHPRDAARACRAANGVLGALADALDDEPNGLETALVVLGALEEAVCMRLQAALRERAFGPDHRLPVDGVTPEVSRVATFTFLIDDACVELIGLGRELGELVGTTAVATGANRVAATATDGTVHVYEFQRLPRITSEGSTEWN